MISQETINEGTRRLVATYNPVEIYVFGLYAWGLPTEDSDLDLLIVVDESNEKSYNRVRPGYDALDELEIPKDILVYTKAEFETRAHDITTIGYKIKKEGRLVYARA